jgi:hypothetical protein
MHKGSGDAHDGRQGFHDFLERVAGPARFKRELGALVGLGTLSVWVVWSGFGTLVAAGEALFELEEDEGEARRVSRVVAGLSAAELSEGDRVLRKNVDEDEPAGGMSVLEAVACGDDGSR